MTWYRSNPAGVAAAMRSPEMVNEMYRRARLGMRFAQSISPYQVWTEAERIRREREGNPHYIDQFRVLAGVKDGKAWARLENTALHAKYLEWGTRYMRAQRILGKAADFMASI